VAAEGLDETWLGKRITEENVDELIALAEEHSFNPAGEGGEYETFVVKTPLYELSVSGKAEGKRFIIEEVNILDSD
ncbi:MAG: TIGR00289 family protein, partial [Candidatus Diapherotrites archaeon]|nr:TIGR00289 family protein [Candidatus Diapherotrites archaeon]